MSETAITIRPFSSTDTVALLECWDQALPLDSITRDLLESRILLDHSYETGSLQLAWQGTNVVGFITSFVLLKPIEKTGMRDDTGFVTAFGVRPDFLDSGAGPALLSAADDFFRARGRRLALLSPYTPNYFVPGIDKDNYPALLGMLEAHGYVEYSEALAADALIGTFVMPDKAAAAEQRLLSEGIVIRHYTRNDLTAYMDFQRELMPGPWVEDARRNLLDLSAGRFQEDAIWLAVDTRAEGSEKIIGFCQHEHEHFGPFGVADVYQGKGIGSVLLARTLVQMRKKGCHSAWVLWTGQRALDGVYGRLGFKLSRRFAIMKREL